MTTSPTPAIAVRIPVEAADVPVDVGVGGARCGIDSVEIARIERLLASTPAGELGKIFSARELADSGDGPGRSASLAARFAAKEACVKLFPRELAAGRIEPSDFAVERDGYGAPRIACTQRAQALLDHARLSAIAISLTHDRSSASAVALALPIATEAPLAGRVLYHLFPVRRQVIVDNLRRVFGAAIPASEIRRLAQAHYAHLARLVSEFLRFRLMSAEKRRSLVRIEGRDAFIGTFERRRGVIVLTGHFGNWEVATVAGIQHYPQMRGHFHFVRRPIKPRWLDRLVTRRFHRAGFGVIGKRGSLDRIVDALEAGDVVVFPFDQYAGGADGIDVEFFGESVGTFKSLAILALATGAVIVPASCWHEPDGRHVLRFEEPVPAVDCDDTNEAIRRTTRACNAALEQLVLRHPEQWWWVHRRFRPAKGVRSRPEGVRSCDLPARPAQAKGKT